jgi:hypothetical protein
VTSWCSKFDIGLLWRTKETHHRRWVVKAKDVSKFILSFANIQAFTGEGVRRDLRGF